jgi:tetratricopeptide (TPR) repeat protein
MVLLCSVAVGPLCAQEARDLSRKGLTEYQAGNYKEAAELLQKAMQLDPKLHEAFYTYFQLMKSAKKAQEGRKYLKKAYDLEPTNTTYKEEIVKILKEDLAAAKQAKDEVKIDQISANILKVSPEELEFALPMIVKHFEAKEFDQVKSKVQMFLEKNKEELPKYNSAAIGEMYYLVARIEFDEKNYKSALVSAEKATRYPMDRLTEAKELVTKCRKVLSDMVNGYLLAGKKLIGEGQNDKAVDEFNKGLAIDPENQEILSQVELMDDRKSVQDMVANANKVFQDGKMLEARDALEAVLRIQPKNKQVRESLKIAVDFEEKFMKRLGKAEKLPRASSERVSMLEGYLNMGKRFLDVKNYKEAQTAFDRALVVIELDPKLEKYKSRIEAEMSKINAVDHAKQLWEKGREQYKTGEWEECLKTLSQLPQDYTIDILSYIGYCHWKLDDKEKAKEFAHRQVERQPDNNRAKFVLANIFFDAGDNGSANKLTLEIKESDPEYPGIDDLVYKTGALRWGPLVIPLLVIGILLYIAHVIYKNLPEYYKNAGINRGKQLLKKGMFKEAIEALIDVKKMPNVDAYDGAVISRILAQCFLKTAAYDKAIGECKHLLAINPTDPESHSWLGFAYLGRRMVSPESLPELLNLYKSEKNNKALVSLLGQHYTAQKVLTADGVEVLERWHDMDPTNPDVLKALGKFYLQKGRSDATALKVFEAMMTTSKPEPEFMLGVAKIHLRMGEHEPCLKICENVLSMDVNNELVHPILRECYKKMNKINDLIDIYRAFLAENPYNVAFQKGLIEAQRMAKSMGAQPQTEGPADVPANLPPETELKDNEIQCPNCSKVNQQTDYYCQGCGQNLSQG